MSDQVAASSFRPSPSYDLPQLKQSFARDGYVIFRDVVSKPGLRSMQHELAREFEEWKKSGKFFDGGGLLSGHINCAPGEVARFAADDVRRAGLMDVIQELFATQPNTMRVGLNLNLPNSVPQHYHMDGVFLESFVIANVAVVDTDLQNGAIDVIPGTNRRFYKYWEFASERIYKQSRRLPLNQGDLLVRVSTLWHRGMPNYTNVARPMLAFTFGEKGVEALDPFAAGGGKIRFEPNWFNPGMLGRLRERTVRVAPITYSAYRFVSSLVGSKGYAA